MSIAIQVTRFEANLLQITRSIIGAAPPRSSAAVLVCGITRPTGLSSRCVALLKQMLSRGVVLQLLRFGGWRQRRWLHGNETVAGRAWLLTAQEHLPLEFSEQSMEFLLWLTATPIGVEREWESSEPLTLGDRLLIFLAYDALQEFPSIQRYSKTFGQSELCRLAWPSHFLIDDALDFSPWLESAGALSLELLEDKLVDCWLAAASHRASVADIKLNRSYASSQRHVFKRFIGACHRMQRIDFARPILRAQRKLTSQRSQLDAWCGGLDLSGQPVSERFAARRDSLSMLETIQTFEEWTRWARSIGFVDEEYSVAQFWLSIWEQFGGEKTHEVARELRRQANPLASAGNIAEETRLPEQLR